MKNFVHHDTRQLTFLGLKLCVQDDVPLADVGRGVDGSTDRAFREKAPAMVRQRRPELEPDSPPAERWDAQHQVVKSPPHLSVIRVFEA